MKLKTVSITLVSLCLASCAHGPKIVRVSSTSSGLANQNHQVFYSLPRSIVQVELPVKTRTLRCGLLHWGAAIQESDLPISLPGKCPDQLDATEFDVGELVYDGDSLKASERCSPAALFDSTSSCGWKFKPRTLADDGRLLSCNVADPNGSVRTDVIEAGSPRFLIRSVPDREHIYAVSLKPEAFEKLEFKMGISAHGAPTNFSSTSSSALVEATKTTLGIASGTMARRLLTLDTKSSVLAAVTAANDQPLVEKLIEPIVNQIVVLEEQRVALIQSTDSNPDLLTYITGEQKRLRAILEGDIREKEEKLNLEFNPESQTNGTDGSKVTSDAIVNFSPCGKRTPSAQTSGEFVTAYLILEPDTYSEKWIEYQTPTAKEANEGDLGFRFRVPQRASACIRLQLRDQSEPKECRSDDIRSSGPLLVNQLGIVRALPRRIGWGAGSVSAELDPQTGALRVIGSEASGSLQRPFVSAVTELERDNELDALQREKTELELRVSICKSRKELGLPAPADCPE